MPYPTISLASAKQRFSAGKNEKRLRLRHWQKHGFGRSQIRHVAVTIVVTQSLLLTSNKASPIKPKPFSHSNFETTSKETMSTQVESIAADAAGGAMLKRKAKDEDVGPDSKVPKMTEGPSQTAAAASVPPRLISASPASF